MACGIKKKLPSFNIAISPSRPFFQKMIRFESLSEASFIIFHKNLKEN